MGRGLFGGWSAEEQTGTALDGVEEAEAEEVQEAAAQQAQQAQPAQQAQQKVSLDDLFSGVWLLEGETGEEEAAAAEVGDEDWDVPPAEEEEAAAAPAPAADGTSAAASTAPAAVGPDQLVALPADEDLPGGVGEQQGPGMVCQAAVPPSARAVLAVPYPAAHHVCSRLAASIELSCICSSPWAEGDALAAVLGAEAAAADWARKGAAAATGQPTADGTAFATLGGRPVKRQRGDHEWAIK